MLLLLFLSNQTLQTQTGIFLQSNHKSFFDTHPIALALRQLDKLRDAQDLISFLRLAANLFLLKFSAPILNILAALPSLLKVFYNSAAAAASASLFSGRKCMPQCKAPVQSPAFS